MATFSDVDSARSISTAHGLHLAQIYSGMTLSPLVHGRGKRFRLPQLSVLPRLLSESVWRGTDEWTREIPAVDYLEKRDSHTVSQDPTHPLLRAAEESYWRVRAIDALKGFIPITSTVSMPLVRGLLRGLDRSLKQFSYFGIHLSLTKDAEPAPPRNYVGLHTLIIDPKSYAGAGAWTDQHLALLDPTPPVSYALSHLDYWPGLLMWDSEGRSALIPHRMQISEQWINFRLQSEQSAAQRKHTRIDAIRDWVENNMPVTEAKRVLHLSDVHVDLPRAVKNRPKVLAELDKMWRGSIDAIVVTGDFVQQPTSKAINSALDLLAELRPLQVKPVKRVLLVPGNHDVRWAGNKIGAVGSSQNEFRQRVHWTPIVSDADVQALFIGFDSNISGNLARGEVAQNPQLDDLERDLKSELAANPTAQSHFRVALVHHHPLQYSKVPEEQAGSSGTVIRVLRDIKWAITSPVAATKRAYSWVTDRESFLRMLNGEGFMQWCDSHGIRLVLHGHKHKARRSWWNNRLLVVGCGASFGVEGQPYYVIIEIHPPSATWFVRFYEYDEKLGNFSEVIVETDNFVH